MAIDGDYVTVNAGLKSEGIIPRQQFLDDNGELLIAVGDEVRVALVSLEDGNGETQLSRERAKRYEAWQVLEQAYANDEIVTGRITGKVRGGFTVSVNSVNAFYRALWWISVPSGTLLISKIRNLNLSW